MFLNNVFLQGGVFSASPNPQAGGPPLVGGPRLLIQVAYACECGDEPSGSVKCGEFLD